MAVLAGESLLEKTMDFCRMPQKFKISESQHQNQQACIRNLMKCINQKVQDCGTGCEIPSGSNHQAIIRSCAEFLGTSSPDSNKVKPKESFFDKDDVVEIENE